MGKVKASHEDFSWVKGGVTVARGFQAAGIACGIKRRKKDLALIFSEVPAVAAGVFTQNRLQAAPVIVTKEHIRVGKARAILINSGNANCATGDRGLENAYQMCTDCAGGLGIKATEVLVASTGIIGRFLPMEVLQQGIERLTKELNSQGGRSAAEAILTTDHTLKEAAVQFSLNRKKVSIGGMAKGAGMIAPQMATMLCFITTDAKITRSLLQKGLNRLVESTFNAITIDGEMSTNDMVIVLANGQAANPTIQREGEAYQQFIEGLRRVMDQLGQMIVRDGEGATKFVEIDVSGAKKKEDARRVAHRIANSLLVKTMLYGGDPNWGRVAACVGSSGVSVRMHRVSISIGPILFYQKGQPQEHNPEQLRQVLSDREVQMGVDLGEGKESFRVWTTDLSEEYVRINSGYTT